MWGWGFFVKHCQGPNSDFLILKGVNTSDFPPSEEELQNLGTMNANLTIEQVPELKCELSNLADKLRFVDPKQQCLLVWNLQ